MLPLTPLTHHTCTMHRLAHTSRTYIIPSRPPSLSLSLSLFISSSSHFLSERRRHHLQEERTRVSDTHTHTQREREGVCVRATIGGKWCLCYSLVTYIFRTGQVHSHRRSSRSWCPGGYSMCSAQVTSATGAHTEERERYTHKTRMYVLLSCVHETTENET